MEYLFFSPFFVRRATTKTGLLAACRWGRRGRQARRMRLKLRLSSALIQDRRDERSSGTMKKSSGISFSSLQVAWQSEFRNKSSQDQHCCCLYPQLVMIFLFHPKSYHTILKPIILFATDLFLSNHLFFSCSSSNFLLSDTTSLVEQRYFIIIMVLKWWDAFAAVV